MQQSYEERRRVEVLTQAKTKAEEKKAEALSIAESADFVIEALECRIEGIRRQWENQKTK